MLSTHYRFSENATNDLSFVLLHWHYSGNSAHSWRIQTQSLSINLLDNCRDNSHLLAIADNFRDFLLSHTRAIAIRNAIHDIGNFRFW